MPKYQVHIKRPLNVVFPTNAVMYFDEMPEYFDTTSVDISKIEETPTPIPSPEIISKKTKKSTIEEA
jgi:hypothetical protein